jgi:hypothetical protein
MDDETALRTQLARVKEEREDAELLLAEIRELEDEKARLLKSVEQLESSVVEGSGAISDVSVESSIPPPALCQEGSTSGLQGAVDQTDAVPSYRGMRDVLAAITEHGRVMEFNSRESTVRRAGV